MAKDDDTAALIERSEGYAELIRDLGGARLDVMLAQDFSNHIQSLAAALSRAQADAARMREALEPFAAWAAAELDYNIPRAVAEDDNTPVLGLSIGEGGSIGEITVGDMKRARAALEPRHDR